MEKKHTVPTLLSHIFQMLKLREWLGFKHIFVKYFFISKELSSHKRVGAGVKVKESIRL